MYDIVMPVLSRHNHIASLSIASLARHAKPRHIYVMTSSDNLHYFENLQKLYPVVPLDENQIIPGISVQTIGDFIEKKGQNRTRAGWYFQQFLKMSASRIPNVSEYYLIWDADTVMLKPISFFNNAGQALIKPSFEYHQPYFDTFRQIFGKERNVDFSFISEHMFINRRYMDELITVIGKHSEKKQHWVWNIMNAVETEHLSGAGFSEYETYGNYVSIVHPGSMAIRPLGSIRYGARKFGLNPNSYDLYRLSLSYSYASFESWDTGKPLKILSEKIISAILYYTWPGRYLNKPT
jgi:hypothetical protein